MEGARFYPSAYSLAGFQCAANRRLLPSSYSASRKNCNRVRKKRLWDILYGLAAMSTVSFPRCMYAPSSSAIPSESTWDLTLSEVHVDSQGQLDKSGTWEATTCWESTPGLHEGRMRGPVYEPGSNPEFSGQIIQRVAIRFAQKKMP